jgi:phage protein D
LPKWFKEFPGVEWLTVSALKLPQLEEKYRTELEVKGKKLTASMAELAAYELLSAVPVAVKGFKCVIDEQAWIISRVVHNLNGNGYTTGLELEVKVSDVEYESEELNQE